MNKDVKCHYNDYKEISEEQMKKIINCFFKNNIVNQSIDMQSGKKKFNL